MSNACYTQYRIEAPDGEIEHLVRELNAWGRQGDSGDGSNLVADSHVPELTEENVKTYQTGTSVLSFETETRRGPLNLDWREVILAFAPHAVIYYYAENLPDEIARTNDVWQRYFKATYVFEAQFTEKTPPSVRKAFSEYGEYRHRTDQLGWYGYVGSHGLRKLIAPLVPTRRRYRNEILQEFREFAQELDWQTGTFINIQPIDFVKDDLTHVDPCRTCKEVAELYEEIATRDRNIYELSLEVDRLKRRIARMTRDL